MYSLIFTDIAIASITQFVSSLHRKNIDIYVDSWISEETLIIEAYLKLGDKVEDAIYDIIDTSLTAEVLGKMISENHVMMTPLTYGNFRLFIKYSEDSLSKIRYIEDIEFFRK